MSFSKNYKWPDIVRYFSVIEVMFSGFTELQHVAVTVSLLGTHLTVRDLRGRFQAGRSVVSWMFINVESLKYYLGLSCSMTQTWTTPFLIIKQQIDGQKHSLLGGSN